MIRPEDERAIEDLFDRLSNVERNSDRPDRDAAQLIYQRLRENPSAAYFMAQTIIVQEAALREQQKRIEELERSSAQRSDGGFLDSIFGDDRPAPRQASQASSPPQRRSPWGNVEDTPRREQRGGSGFLAGAAQTALGVTGGVLLGNAIAGMFGGNDAHAAEAPSSPDNAGLDDTGLDDTGLDAGNWGDFDIGGEF